jgi:hypothetical protein
VEDRKLRGQLRNVSKLELLVRPRTALAPPLLALMLQGCWRAVVLGCCWAHEAARPMPFQSLGRLR